MGLGEIRGQERALRSLAAAMGQDRFHHAYRFEGPEGVGKELVAVGLAKVLNCTGGSEIVLEGGSGPSIAMPDFCGECPACRKIEGGNHPDLRLVTRPEGKTRITISQIRDLHGFIVYPPSEGKAKAVIVRDADCITEEAANAFLKMLEEPPDRTHYFLVTSKPHRLLPTIKSRSVPVRFSPLEKKHVIEILATLEPERDGEEIDAVVGMCGGSISAGRAFLSQDWNERLELLLRADRAFAGATHDMVAFLDEVTLDRQTTSALLDLLETWYRDVAWSGVGGEHDGLMLGSLSDRILARSGSMSAEQAAIRALCIPEHRDLLEGYVNPRMVLERLYLEFRRAEV